MATVMLTANGFVLYEPQCTAFARERNIEANYLFEAGAS